MPGRRPYRRPYEALRVRLYRSLPRRRPSTLYVLILTPSSLFLLRCPAATSFLVSSFLNVTAKSAQEYDGFFAWLRIIRAAVSKVKNVPRS